MGTVHAVARAIYISQKKKKKKLVKIKKIGGGGINFFFKILYFMPFVHKSYKKFW